MRNAKKNRAYTKYYGAACAVLLAAIVTLGVSPAATLVRNEYTLYGSHTAALGDLPDVESLKIKNEELRRAGSTKIPILIYHSIRPYHRFDTKTIKRFVVPPDVLDSQLKYLYDSGYTTVTLEEVAAYFQGSARLPAKPVILTFDDGWRNHYTLALPILEKYGMKATFFVFTEALGKSSFMTWEHVALLAAAGMEIGNHTKTHPYLFKITNEKRLHDEIIVSKQLLEERLGMKIKVFATPFSRTNDAIGSIAEKAGYTAARTESWGAYQSKDTLNFTGIEAPNTLQRFKELLSL